MNENLTYIALVLDRSSSMSSVREATIAGFNAFLEEQRKAPGEALVTFASFADTYELHRDAVPLGSIEPLNEQTYSPHGNTALYDGIGKTIDAIGTRLAAMPEAHRPAKVLVVIQTDGEENASRTYNRLSITSMINHQRTKYNWNFVFIGASEAAVAGAIAMGVPQNFTRQYTPDVAGTRQLFAYTSASVANYRGVASESLGAVYDSHSFFVDPAVVTPVDDGS